MFDATMPREVLIETDRLVLRPVGEGDLDAIVDGINDFAVAGMLARVPYPYSRADAESFLGATREAAGRNIALVIADESGVVGGLGLTGIRSEREFGYWLRQTAWGKGYATEAGRGFLDFLFGELGLDIVRSGVFHDNPASLHVQNKLGFERIGTRMIRCLARGRDVEHIDTILTRERYQAIAARG
ncbi:MAG TPA: GNAT family N-acetyltransferase [Bauldia sp.]|nr:GNAT family N-acetyltransferase [Bauldia sp.]